MVRDNVIEIIEQCEDALNNDESIFIDGVEVTDSRWIKDVKTYATVLLNTMTDAKERGGV